MPQRAFRRENWRVVFGLGFVLGVAAGVGAGLAAAYSEHTLDEAIGVLTTEALPGVDALTAAVGISSIALWSVTGDTLRSVAYGLVTGATVYAVIGTWDVVRDTTFHGLKRNELLELDSVQDMLTRER